MVVYQMSGTNRVTKEEVLAYWVRKYESLDTKSKKSFLEKSELEELVLLDWVLIKEAIEYHQKLYQALEHARWREDRSNTNSLKGSCGCSYPNDAARRTAKKAVPTSDGGGNSQRSKSKKKASRRKVPKNPSNTFPYASERGGGPKYRRPPTGGIAKGY